LGHLIDGVDLLNLGHQLPMHFSGPWTMFLGLVLDEGYCSHASSKLKIFLVFEIFPMIYHTTKMEFICKTYGPNNITIQIFPMCSSGEHFNTP
jgi:hypothetical protein